MPTRVVLNFFKTFATRASRKMPPKKGAAEPKLLLGRPSNNLKMGVVGLPNVGKSTFFNAITNSAAAAENYPFCTIDPEESRVAVPDERLDWLVNSYKPKTTIPAYLTVIDIAGLVKGASSGEGLGNAFLSHIKAVDGIFHVVRAFSDDDVTHVEGAVDPIRDMQIIHEELRLKDEEFLTKHLKSLEHAYSRKGNNLEKKFVFELDTLRKVLKMIAEDKKDVRTGTWTNAEIEIINTLTLITAKPVVYLVNMSEKDYVRRKNKWLAKIKAWVDANSSAKGDGPNDAYSNPPILPFSCKLESLLSTTEGAEAKEQFLKQMADAYGEPGKDGKVAEVKSILPKIVTTGYQALHLVYYFTCGPM